MITRFAPSPTGLLHLGHAFSALVAAKAAQEQDGICLLRIEDIDQTRARPRFEEAIYRDLRWLGLTWPIPALRQSERMDAYRAALARLIEMGLCYPCRCSRGDIRRALSAPQEGALMQGPDGVIYPGTCRARPMAAATDSDAIRLDMAKACALLETPLTFHDHIRGPQTIDISELAQSCGDIVLARRDIGTSYHLAVCVDDALQDVTLVVRGEDLFDATPIHVLLQRLLGYEVPDYLHHHLIRDTDGKRLAKRDDARAIAALRDEDGLTPAEVRALVGF